MPHWMVHPDHGTMPVYSMSEVAQVQSLGWSLLNTGERPEYPKRAPEPSPDMRAVLGLLDASLSAGDPPAAPVAPLASIAAPAHDRDKLIPAVSLHEGRDEAHPVKRKPGRPRKVQQ